MQSDAAMISRLNNFTQLRKDLAAVAQSSPSIFKKIGNWIKSLFKPSLDANMIKKQLKGMHVENAISSPADETSSKENDPAKSVKK